MQQNVDEILAWYQQTHVPDGRMNSVALERMNELKTHLVNFGGAAPATSRNEITKGKKAKAMPSTAVISKTWLTLLQKGVTAEDIAAELAIDPKRVRAEINAYKKAGVPILETTVKGGKGRPKTQYGIQPGWAPTAAAQAAA
jgi:hypothetical protein